MTNREFYKEQILDIACSGERIAVDKNTNELCACHSISCSDCLFSCSSKNCIEIAKEWCNAEYVEPCTCPFEKGELVEVSEFGDLWFLRYFSHINNSLESKYLTYANQNKSGEVVNWKYCRKYGTLGGLVKENEE